MPQAKDVRDEVAHIEPAAPRPDEQYARPSEEFLAKRAAPGDGQARRTLVDLQVTTVFPNGLASRFHQVVYQPLTEAAAADVARVRVLVRDRQPGGPAPRRARVPERRAGRRGHRERRGRDGRRPRRRDVHERAQLLRALPAARAGRRRRAAVPRRGRRAAQRVRRLLRRGRVHAERRADRARASTC